MKKLILFILILIPAVCFALNPFVGVSTTYFSHATGGTDDCMDGKDGNVCVNGEVAVVFDGATQSTYVMNTNSSSPSGSIAPAVHPGTKKWEIYGSSASGTHVYFSTGMVAWLNGTTNAVVKVIPLQTGEIFVPERLEVWKSDGTSDEDFTAEIYDATTAEVMWGPIYGFGTGAPDSSGSGDLVKVFVSNSTGAPVDGEVIVSGRITQ